MGKTFKEYAANRALQASPEETAWVSAFDASYPTESDPGDAVDPHAPQPVNPRSCEAPPAGSTNDELPATPDD